MSIVEVTLAVKRPLSEDEEGKLLAEFGRMFGDGVELPLVYVDEIPRAAGGKFETFRSEVTAP